MIDRADAAESALPRAAASAAARAADAASTAHLRVAEADSSPADAFSARAAADAAYAADSRPTRAALWSSLSIDATRIAAKEPASALAGAPLWPNASPRPPFGVPEPLWSLWEDMKTALLAANEDWDVWTDWYEDRLAGRVRDKARELAYVRIGNDLWDQGPAAVNAEIKKHLPPPPPAPVANVPSAFTYGWTSQGTITIAAGAQNWPVFPFAGGEREHTKHLDTCRTLATDAARLLRSDRYNARHEYAETLNDYARDLPRQPGDGNIFLADAHARILRAMFAAEAAYLQLPIAAKLQTLLQHHIGLRAYYPQLAEFYESVRSGHLELPLPLDAVQDFIQVIRDNTPDIFDPNVSETLAQTAEPVPEILPPGPEAPPLDSAQPVPPPDPLGEIDPEKSQRFTVASEANALWHTLLQGEKVAKDVEGWSKVIDILTPPVTTILDYLRHIIP